MPEAQEKFQQAVAAVLEAAMFENWLRFYFIVEQKIAPNSEPELKIELPPKSLERIKNLYPSLYPMAEKMNNRPVDFESSRAAVLSYLVEHIDGKTLPKGEAQKVLQSSTFQLKLNLFHTWAQLHEDQLDQGFAEFGAWKQLFAKWLETPAVKDLALQMQTEMCR